MSVTLQIKLRVPTPPPPQVGSWWLVYTGPGYQDYYSLNCDTRKHMLTHLCVPVQDQVVNNLNKLYTPTVVGVLRGSLAKNPYRVCKGYPMEMLTSHRLWLIWEYRRIGTLPDPGVEIRSPLWRPSSQDFPPLSCLQGFHTQPELWLQCQSINSSSPIPNTLTERLV